MESYRTLRELLRRALGRALRRVLPNGLRRHLRVSRELSRPSFRIYWKRLLLRSLGLRSDQRRVPAQARSVLFVCHGNIFRSPMAEALLRQRLASTDGPKIDVASAGLEATRGKPAAPKAIDAAGQFGVSLAEHRARPLTPDLVGRYVTILIMDYKNEANLLTQFPEAEEKLFFLGAFGERNQIEIVDPYGGDDSDVRDCYATLASCVDSMLRSSVLPAA